MVIVSRLGIFNLDNIERISCDHEVVQASAGGAWLLISSAPDAYDKIVEAIKNNENYVEVD